MIPDLVTLLALLSLSWVAKGLPTQRRWISTTLSTLTAVAAVLALAHVIYVAAQDFRQKASGDRHGQAHPGPTADAVPLIVTKTEGRRFTEKEEWLFSRYLHSIPLKPEWIVINDPLLPIQLSDSTGVSIGYHDAMAWSSRYVVKVAEPIKAVETRFVLLDIWGDRIETLADESIVDLPGGTSKRFEASWTLPPGATSKHWLSIAYVARVRMRDGRILVARSDLVLEEFRKISAKFLPAQLEPGRGSPNDSTSQGV